MNQARGVFLRADFRMGDIFIGQPRMQARSGVFIPFKEKALESFEIARWGLTSTTNNELTLSFRTHRSSSANWAISKSP